MAEHGGVEPPRVRSGLVVLRRDRDTWQIGLDPTRAVLVRGADAGVAAGLRALDRGHHPDADPAALADVAPRLVDRLIDYGLLAPAGGATVHHRHVQRLARRRGDTALAELRRRPDPMPRRLRARVAVTGTGPVAALVAVGLAHAGIRTVAVLGGRRPVRPGDLLPGIPHHSALGTPWADAVSAAVRALGSATTLVDGRPPDLVVLTEAADVDLPWCDPVLGEPWQRLGVAHLTATAAGSGDVSPLVLPGRTACLHCRDLTRADADAHWSALAVGLRALPQADTPAALGVPLATVTAALGVARAVAYVDDGVPTGPQPGLLVDACGLPTGEYSLLAHPRCGCRWAPATVTMDR